jgi:hypothetical protein
LPFSREITVVAIAFSVPKSTVPAGTDYLYFSVKKAFQHWMPVYRHFLSSSTKGEANGTRLPFNATFGG